jgi:8-oxo-dGTP diphosphatase
MFNVRVYGLMVNERNEILVSDEIIRGHYITKFIGGGLEYGEGTRACLQREFLEEVNWKVEVGKHIYTTDFFQPSAYHPDHQIISIYYQVHPLEDAPFLYSSQPFDFSTELMERYKTEGCIETPRWISLEDFNEDSVTLPIDKFVASNIKQWL